MHLAAGGGHKREMALHQFGEGGLGALSGVSL